MASSPSARINPPDSGAASAGDAGDAATAAMMSTAAMRHGAKNLGGEMGGTSVYEISVCAVGCSRNPYAHVAYTD